jgi:hypothetical protein
MMRAEAEPKSVRQELERRKREKGRDSSVSLAFEREGEGEREGKHAIGGGTFRLDSGQLWRTRAGLPRSNVDDDTISDDGLPRSLG